MKKTITMLTIVTVLYSCQQPSIELTDAERESIKTEIKQITNSTIESGNRKDVVELYSNFSDKTTGVHSGAIMESWEQHKQQGADFFASLKEIEYKIDNMTVDVLSRDAAVLYGRYAMTATDTAGTPINAKPALTYVFTKENGKWKIIHFHVSDPPKE